MNELQPLIDLLGGKAGWLTTLITWLGVLVPLAALFATKFKHWISDKLNDIAASSELDDDEYLTRLFSEPWYRFIAFLSRFTPFHLPTLADLQRAISLQHAAAIDAGGSLRARSGPTGSILGALALCFLLSALCFSTGCGTTGGVTSSVNSNGQGTVGANFGNTNYSVGGSYNVATGEWSVGVAIQFKTPPPADLRDLLSAAEAVPTRDARVYVIPRYARTNSNQGLAFEAALTAGATLKPYRP